MEAFTFWNPVKLLFGPGMVERVGIEAKAIAGRALLVSGKGSAERSGLLARVQELLEKEGIAVTHLKGVDPNPRLHSVKGGIRLCKENDVELVIALGGGSVMDCSKVIAAGVLYPGDPWDIVRHGQHPWVPPTESLPTMTIPTLAATGSEMNSNAVITNTETCEKCFASKQACMYPRVCVADPALTCTVPPNHTAYGAADTIAHVLESYLNGADDVPIQDRFQEGIMQTVMGYAPKAVTEPNDLDARTHLQWAGIVALNGWAQAGSGGNFAMHQIEHVLSAHYDIAHGAGLAVLMPAWMKLACLSRMEKYVQFASRVFGISAEERDPESVARDGINCFDSFLRDLGIATRLSELGIGTDRFDRICDDILRISGDKKGLLPRRPPLDRDGIMKVLDLAK